MVLFKKVKILSIPIKKYPYCHNYDHMEQCCVCQWCQDGMPCNDLIFPPLFKKKYNPDTFKGYSLEHYVDKEGGSTRKVKYIEN